MTKKKKEDYLPTPKEIREGCRALREKWTDQEFFKRAGLKQTEYRVPVCEVEGSYDEFNSELKPIC